MRAKHYRAVKRTQVDRRLFVIKLFFAFFACVIIVRLGMLQVAQAGFYQSLAEGQHSFYEELFAERGEIFVRDWKDNSEYAAATTELRAVVYADPRKIENPAEAARQIAEILGYNTDLPQAILAEKTIEAEVATQTIGSIADILVVQTEPVVEEQVEVPVEGEVAIAAEPVFEDPTQEEYLKLIDRLAKKDDPYEPVARSVSEKTLQRILDLDIEGIGYVYENVRAYPEDDIGGQVFGFLGQQEDGESVGYYGIEGYFDEFLGGANGFLDSTTDAGGRWIGTGKRQFQPAVDGGDLVLTIDRTVQHKVCEILREGVLEYQADSGVVVILEPQTGKVMAMCGYPDFDPDAYGEVENGRIYQNQAVVGAYEPGSVFKPLVMAAAIDVGAVGPTTTFDDTGEVTIGPDTIRNSDKKSHGIQTMTEVLDKSLNTGMVFTMRQMGREVMQDYIRKLGFGEKTGVELQGEVKGNLASLEESGEIYPATASFGQGILVTPIQLAAAYNTLANQGQYLKPYIVEERRFIDGTVEVTQPSEPVPIFSSKTAATVGAMLVSVVENGHAELAKVDGYYLAGKTGTAQVAKENGRGYDETHTKATFAGYGPVEDPRFTMVVMLDRPKTSPWASYTSVPIFAEISDFLLTYLASVPTRTDQ